MRRAYAAVLLVLLAAPAGAQETLESAFAAARALRLDAAAKAGPPPRPAKPVLRVPAASEQARPDAFDDKDDFRRALLAPARSDRWFVPTELGGVLLVVQKGYVSETRLDTLAADLQEAVFWIPRLTGRPPLVRARFTVYVYENGPLSEADVPGAQPGEKGVMLRFVKDDAEPLFHEVTHTLAGAGRSQSLNEGVAEWVQANRRPGRAHAFVPAGANPDALAKDALAKRPLAFRETIGAPGFYFVGSNREIRFDFYYCSWSYVNFLLRRGSLATFWSVLDQSGAPEAYSRAYGRSREQLVAEWIAEISR